MISWGIIGCGNVTEVKSGPAFNKVAGSRLVAVMRRNANLARDYAARHKVPAYYNDANDLINDPQVNIVYVATPPGSHALYALKTLKAGKPVYIEKPMALNYQECSEINKASKRYKLPVFVAYYRRTLPGFLKIKDLIDQGEVGKVRLVNLQILKHQSEDEEKSDLPWRVLPRISGGGHFFDLASHQLDYLDFVFGPVQKVKSVAVNQAGLYQAEDLVSAIFIMPGNIIVSGAWCFTVAGEAERDLFEIIGERGIIKSSTFTFEQILLENNKGRQVFINERPDNVQYYLIEQIVKSLTTGSPVVSTGITAARTSKVMDRVVKEYYLAVGAEHQALEAGLINNNFLKQ